MKEELRKKMEIMKFLLNYNNVSNKQNRGKGGSMESLTNKMDQGVHRMSKLENKMEKSKHFNKNKDK